MRWLVRSIVATAALHLALPVVTAAADNAAPPEIKINPQSAAAATSAGISAETLDAVAKAIQEKFPGKVGAANVAAARVAYELTLAAVNGAVHA